MTGSKIGTPSLRVSGWPAQVALMVIAVVAIYLRQFYMAAIFAVGSSIICVVRQHEKERREAASEAIDPTPSG